MEQLVKLPVRPAADSRNIIQGENYRITMLTEGLVRLEYSEDGIFEDRATQTVINRDFSRSGLSGEGNSGGTGNPDMAVPAYL